MKFLKSPMNYIGGKYKLLPQITCLFPNEINRFIDLFAGGLDVAININATEIFCNDINTYAINLYKEFQKHSINTILKRIDDIVESYKLSKTNKDGYVELRNHYNQSKDQFELFALICYGFNHQIRFNNKQEFNNPFGYNRSCFNSKIRENLILFRDKIENFNFYSKDFKKFDFNILSDSDFLYADPPYYITCGSYNDGKRGFDGWSIEDDLRLFSILDELNKKKVKFALSNVVEHKGNVNNHLNDWMQKYNIHILNFNYNNSNYHSTSKKNTTTEVLITNY